MNEIRGRNACAELSPGGQILVAGSDNNGGSYLSTAELYDPSTGTWSAAGNMKAGRWNHSATLLPSGKVLFAGGFQDDKVPPEMSSAELYDPATKTFTTTGSMTDPRKLFALVTFGTGALAIAGEGYMGGLLSVERYDSTSGTWSTIAPVTGFHAPSQAVVLAGGKSVLMTGGADEPEIFDGTAWTKTVPQVHKNEEATLTLLDDGHVIAIGGHDPGAGMPSPNAEVYDPKTNKWSATSPMAHARAGHSAVKVTSGLVIVAGGSPSSDVEAYDPATNKFSIVGYLSAPREFMCATTRGTGAIFMGGTTYAGYNAYVPNVDLWEPSPASSPCTTGLECASGKCISGTCDGASDAGVDALPPSDGGFDAQPNGSPTITPGTFQHCAKNSECSTGHCVEGVCCDTACEGICVSCALPSSPGKCAPEPIGVDLKGQCGAALSCTGTCGPEQKCIGSGPGAQCAKSHCTSANGGVGPATCISNGASCPTDQAVPFDCGAYACEPAFGACLSSCSSSTDCAGGFLCDTGSKTCVAPTPAEDSSGCSYGRTTTSALPFAALLALSALARRKRR